MLDESVGYASVLFLTAGFIGAIYMKKPLITKSKVSCANAIKALVALAILRVYKHTVPSAATHNKTLHK